MRTSLGQYRHALEHGHGFVSTVTVATPDAVRRGLTCSVRTRRASSSGEMSQLAHVWGWCALMSW